MNSLRSKGSIFKFYSYLPLIILLISVLNEFDFNYLNLEYFSFNFPFILIFYFTLKDFRYFDYSLVFIAGLINDTVVGLPLGISSFSYMIICIATSYFRNITIRPNQVKDWFYFLFIISLINSINYSALQDHRTKLVLCHKLYLLVLFYSRCKIVYEIFQDEHI